MIKLVDLLSEVIKKVDGKWVVYPKKGGKRLGTHATKEKALKQLAAIEINKENVNEVGDASANMTLKNGETIKLEVNYRVKSSNYTSLSVIAYDNSGKKIGHAYFNSDETNNRKKLTSSDTSVKPEWHRKGVATLMYNYVKKLGYKILPSSDQTHDGIEFFKSLKNVNEVGDASADAYKWKPVGRGTYSNEFTFTTDSGLIYYVKFWDVGDDIIEVAFLAQEPDQYDRPEYSTVTNRGELFKVMSTVAVIVLYYLQSNPEYKYLTYEPSKTTGKDDNRRDKLYRAYMKKMIPGSEEVPSDEKDYIKFKLP